MVCRSTVHFWTLPALSALGLARAWSQWGRNPLQVSLVRSGGVFASGPRQSSRVSECLCSGRRLLSLEPLWRGLFAHQRSASRPGPGRPPLGPLFCQVFGAAGRPRRRHSASCQLLGSGLSQGGRRRTIPCGRDSAPGCCVAYGKLAVLSSLLSVMLALVFSPELALGGKRTPCCGFPSSARRCHRSAARH